MRPRWILILGASIVVAIFIVRTAYLERRELPSQPLDTPIAEVRFEATPLQEAVSDLSQKSGVPIEVDWNELKKIGVWPDERITLRLFNLPARNILRVMLKIVHPRDRISVFELPGQTAVKITTLSATYVVRELRLYDVGDLTRGFSIPTTTDLSCGSTGYNDRWRAVQAVLAIVRQSPGNAPAEEFEWQGRLFVYDTLENHARIQNTLRKIKQLEASTPYFRPMKSPIEWIDAEAQ